MDFTPEEIKEILRKEELKRRREAKKRQAEILALMEEQYLDSQGKLWGEMSISALADSAYGGNGVKWETDFEAKLVSHNHNPERAVIIKELFELSRETIVSQFGEQRFKLFCSWLETESWEQMALELMLAPTACVTAIKEAVAAVRERVGTNPKAFPFSVKLNMKKPKAVSQKIAYKRTLEGKSAAADPENRVYLDKIVPGWKEMSLDALWEKVRSLGYKVSRSGIWRAKKRSELSGQPAWFMEPGWSRGKKIYLSDEDKSLPTKLLAYKYNISKFGAQRAKRVGYFCVNSQNRDRVIPEGRDISALLAKEKAKKAEKSKKKQRHYWDIPLSSEDYNLSARELMDKYCLASVKTARNALNSQRRFFRLTRRQYIKYCAKHGLPCEVAGKAQDSSETDD